MNYIHQFISEELIYALGWTVIHSIWQALLVALLVTAVILGLKKQSTQQRYIAYYTGLVGVLFLAALTFLDLYNWGHESTLQSVIFINDMTIIEFHHSVSEGHISNFFVDYFNQNMPIIVLLWSTGMAFFTLRLVGGFAFIQYLRQHYHYTVPTTLKEQMLDLMDKIRLDKNVQLAESALVKVPMVFGFIKPMILLPLGTINQLAPKEMEAILAHELAHIARNDYMLNVLQSVIEVLFYYNPAVWWLSANIRLERENCCDDIAVALCGNSLTYAKALVSLQEVHHTPPMLAMPFAGKKNQLLHRIQRILKQPQNRNNIMEKVMATGLLILTIGLFSFTAQSNDWYEGENDATTEFEYSIETEKAMDNEITVTISTRDTFPHTKSKHTERITFDDGDSSMELERVDGEIQSLKIDGKTIPESDWDEYAEKIETIPPPPPAPPSTRTVITQDGQVRVITAPSVTPDVHTTRTVITEDGQVKVIRVAPPVPPMPPKCNKQKSKCKSKCKTKRKTIRTENGEDGSTLIIIEKHNGEAPTHIQIDEDEAIVKIDGKKISLNEPIVIDGDEVHIKGIATIMEESHFDFDFPEIESLDFPDLALANIDNLIFEWDNEQDDFFRQSMDQLTEQQRQLGSFWNEEQHEEMEHLFEEKRELLLEQKEQANELRAEAHERFQQMQSEQREHLLEQKESAEQLRRETQERIHLFQKEYQNQMESLRAEAKELREEHLFEMEHEMGVRSHSADLSKILAKELYKDGLINNKNKFRFQITQKELKVNGKLVSSRMHDKYMNLYENLTDSTFDKDSEVNIRHRSNGNQSHSIRKEI